MTATSTSNIQSINVVGSHGMQNSTATIEATTTSLNLGDSVTINLGYSDSHSIVFTGLVKGIQKSESPVQYTITAIDTLIRAMDFFIVSSNPETPFSRQNISAEDLVGDVLALSGLTNYDGDTTNFTVAIKNPVEVNLTSSYDYCSFIAGLVAWHLYADINGKVWFLDRKPYIMGGDSSYKTITLPSILSATYSEDANNLRNRVVLYGAEGITAEASASSPYLPAGFYKTAVVSAQIIDSQTYADQCVAYNLALYNRLTRSVSLTVLGDSALVPRKVLTLNTGITELDHDWYIYGASHTINSGGFTTDLELRR